MSREFITSVFVTLLPVLLLGLTALAAWLSALIARHIRDRRYGAAVTLLAYGAAGVAADLAQHVVAELKDPARPGSWDSVAASAVKREAVALLRSLYPLAIDFVTQVLRDPSKVDALLGTLVERAVVDLKAKAPAKAVELVAAAEPLPSKPLAVTVDDEARAASRRTTDPGPAPAR